MQRIEKDLTTLRKLCLLAKSLLSAALYRTVIFYLGESRGEAPFAQSLLRLIWSLLKNAELRQLIRYIG